MNEITKNELNVNTTPKGLPFKLLLLLFFFFMSIFSPLSSQGQDTPSPTGEALKPQGPKAIESGSVVEQSFLILKERLDRLSGQITKHRSPLIPKTPKYVEKEDLNVPPFPEMEGEDSIQDILLLLRKRLANLHHLLHVES